MWQHRLDPWELGFRTCPPAIRISLRCCADGIPSPKNKFKALTALFITSGKQYHRAGVPISASKTNQHVSVHCRVIAKDNTVSCLPDADDTRSVSYTSNTMDPQVYPTETMRYTSVDYTLPDIASSFDTEHGLSGIP